MQTAPLGNTDLHITRLGLGTWAMGGGGYEFGWGRQEDADSLATIHRALDLGINWIDTAAVYGLGHAEEIIGKALQSVSKRPLVFTKCTLVWDDRGRISHSMRETSIRQEVAVAWALGHPAVTGAIVGGRRPDQLEEIIGAGDFQLNETERNELSGLMQQKV
jgi:aryl-alcohol dehydrogenase-like predicted oxidoreductase